MAVSKPLDVSKVSKVMDAGPQGKRGGWVRGWGLGVGAGGGRERRGRGEGGKVGSEGILHRRKK